MNELDASTPPPALPSDDEMWRAFLSRDAAYEGVFVTGVISTGIFCRPTCSARKPQRHRVRFFASTRDAAFAGFRACKRCRPMEPAGAPPPWLRPLMERVEDDPDARLRDADLRDSGLEPARVRRWFQANHGMTFHAWQRAQRLGRALGRLSLGDDITRTAYDAGFESLSGFSDALRRLTGSSPDRVRGTTTLHLTRTSTPLGPMVIGATDEAVCLLEFADRPMLETQLQRVTRRLDAVPVPGETGATRALAEELDAYFRGRLRRFGVPLLPCGTPFQEAVWAELRTIPYGVTRSYGEQARRMGRPRAVRAVARANGDNRLAVVVPCHRVVGADGRLTGYGGGLWRKRRLLELERRLSGDSSRSSGSSGG